MRTLGCEKNTVDSENAARILSDSGCVITEDPDDADMFLVNTCGFIKDAKQQSIQTIFDIARIKGDRPLIVSGCLTQRYAKELEKELPEADYILGVNDYDRLPEIVTGLAAGRVFAGPCGKQYKELGARRLTTSPWTRSIKIAEGCSNVCSYCIIPAIRGRYRSRREEDILKEARQLAEEGCRELVVIAQDVTFYGRDLGLKDALPGLLRKLSAIEGIEWIRLMYCYEDEITEGLIREIKTNDKICKYIDIPIQHCNDGILKAMDRKSTGDSIRNTITTLRKEVPNITIRTTLIVGFPGETRQQFEELLQFVEDTRFDRLGVFTYSKEEGTKAAAMKGQVRSDVKQRRCDRIMAAQQQISLDHNRSFIGRTIPVLVEETDPDGSFIGRSRMDAPEIDNSVIFTGPEGVRPGDIVNVLITDAFDYDLCGKVVEQ
ncbi:MAG: 30S ribosomal protein S12 methylthiotransferase RimO [Firmicutes bacterium]|nr:30S ribosomal protein S12 methylthiotransferase RimO [Bacillota bacterium]